MKKLLLTVPVVLLLAAACNRQPAVQQNKEVPNSTAVQQTQASIASGQKYLVTAEIKIGSVGGDNKERHFSIFNTNGTFVKTLNAPGDLITGSANNVKTLDGNIYYMSGSNKITSIGLIDVQTGQSRILHFTQTNNTNPENTLYAIIDWDVSNDGSKIAWLSTSGQISVANTDGTNVKTYTSVDNKPPAGNKLKFVGNYLYFSIDYHNLPPAGSSGNSGLQRLNLNNGLIDTVANDLWSNIFSVSNSGKYAVYSLYANNSAQTVIKNLESGSKKYIPQIPYNSQINFSPDETKIIFTPLTGKDQKFDLITIDLSNFKTIHTLNGLNLLAVLSNSQVLAESSNGALEIVNLDGGNSIKLNTNNEYFEGILTAK